MKKKVVYIISHIDRAVGFEEIYAHLHDKFDFTFILLNPADSYFENYCRTNNAPFYRIKYTGKKNLISAFIKIFFLLKKIKPHIVHTHLFDASLIGLTAAKWLKIFKIHTRHHSDFHHIYFPHAVKYDTYINRLSNKIVAVSPSVKNILIEQENVQKEKIVTIYHGFKVKEFNQISEERIDNLKEKYNPASRYPVIGVISRYTEWKGIQYIIPAYKKLLEEYPDALLILANAQGTYEKQITSLLEDVPEESYKQIIFEQDLHALYKLFTVFVHVPITPSAEAFGQVYIESLLSKVPSVFTKSGIANEFLTEDKICLYAAPKNADQIYDGICELLKNEATTLNMVDNAYKYASEQFNLEHQIAAFDQLYSKNY